MTAAHSPYTPEFEHIPVTVFTNSREASRAVAADVAALIRRRQKEGRKVVLGLATGSTPVMFYAELIRLHREEGLSFSNVISFNLDEYLGLTREHPQSYWRFMHNHLFDHIDIPADQIHLPDGTVARADVEAHCANYEEMMREAGGIDFQILGIGRTGHIGFNEPGSPRRSLTRLVHLDPLTRRDAAGDFGGEDNVPRHALTMGVRSILNARRVVLMAWGQHKADIVRTAVEGEVSEHVTASFLQEHENATFVLENAAASSLTRTRTPWRLGPLGEQGLRWDDTLTRRAVLWLADERKKAILKLTDEDYNEAGLQDLLQVHGSAYEANLFGFYQMQHTITGWPGGRDPEKTRAGDAPVRPLRAPSAGVFPKRVLVLSPHPDDVVISMGGTLCRLVGQGHVVKVAHQVSGTGAVPQEALQAMLAFTAESGLLNKDEASRLRGMASATTLPETPETLSWKALIRRQEARAAAAVCGVSEDNIQFLDLPFYDNSDPRRRRLGQEDAKKLQALLSGFKPHLIFAAGDLDDPHGTHRLCLNALREAFTLAAGETWLSEAELWLYRGSWTACPVDEIDLAVPLSPQELLRRRRAVFCHRTQKDQTVLVGKELKEIWASTEERSKQLARSYNALGLAEYEAIEAFRRYTPEAFRAASSL